MWVSRTGQEPHLSHSGVHPCNAEGPGSTLANRQGYPDLAGETTWASVSLLVGWMAECLAPCSGSGAATRDQRPCLGALTPGRLGAPPWHTHLGKPRKGACTVEAPPNCKRN